jgi:regulator of protease activity HflC (stomatin/prohibitin superfamily)
MEVKEMTWLILGIVVIIVLAVRSIKLVGPDEMAVKVIFGEAVDVRESGLVFDLRFLLPGYFKCYLRKYPKKMYNFAYKEREVITRAGTYEDVYYGAQTLKVDSVAYLNFPREKRGKDTTGDDLVDVDMEEGVEKTHPLIKVLRAQVPTDEEELKDWTEEAVLGALRVAFGEMTWMEAVINIKGITEKAEKVFKSADGALIRVGFSRKGIQLVIAEITLPSSLQQAMPDVDRQRLEADAATFEAEQRATETVGTVLKMMAKSRGKKVEEITEEIDQDGEGLKKEFVDLSKDLVVREIALKRGAYVDIRVEGATGIEKVILNALAAWQRMPSGPLGEKPTPEEEEKPMPKGEEKKVARSSSKPKMLRKEEVDREIDSLPEEQRKERAMEVAEAIMKGEVEINYKGE